MLISVSVNVSALMHKQMIIDSPVFYRVHLTSGWKFRMRTLSLPIQNSKKSNMKDDGLSWTKGRKHTVLQWQSDILSHPAALAS